MRLYLNKDCIFYFLKARVISNNHGFFVFFFLSEAALVSIVFYSQQDLLTQTQNCVNIASSLQLDSCKQTSCLDRVTEGELICITLRNNKTRRNQSLISSDPEHYYSWNWNTTGFHYFIAFLCLHQVFFWCCFMLDCKKIKWLCNVMLKELTF